MAYINRKNTEDAIRKYADIKHCNGEQIEYVNGILKSISVISEQPAADVVEVVRCKDCAVPHNKWTGCPKLNGLMPPPDFFCSYGERREHHA